MTSLNLNDIARWTGRNLKRLVAALILAGILASASVILRYDLKVIEAGNHIQGIVLDRWTGDLYYVNAYGRFPVPRQASPARPPS